MSEIAFAFTLVLLDHYFMINQMQRRIQDFLLGALWGIVGSTNLQCWCFSAKTYVKMKESGPVVGACTGGTPGCYCLMFTSSVPLMVKPHQAKSEHESDIALLGSYHFQFTCHTKRKQFHLGHPWQFGTEPILPRFRE